MHVEEALQRFTYIYETKATAKTYRVAIRRYLSWHEPEPHRVQNLDFSNVPAFAQAMKEQGLAKRTIGGYLAAIKQFCDFLKDREIAQISAEQFYKLDKDIKRWNKRNRVRDLPRLPKESTVQATMLVAQATDSEDPRQHLLHLRNRALIETFRATACRVSEAQALKRKDLNADMTAWVRGGKGDKDRMIVFDPKAWDAVQAYLKARDEMGFRVIGEESVFGRHDHIAHKAQEVRRISTNAMRDALEALSKKALVEKLKPHGIRHWRATHFLEDHDITMVQKLLGHEDISTTQVYLHLSNEDLKEAVQGGG